MPGDDSEHRQPDLRLAAELAGIHAAAFAGEGRPWSGPEILALLNERTVAVRLAHRERPEPGGARALAGFVLYRAVAGEAEVLTLSVLPEARRRGIGAGLLAACEDGARAAGAARLFLEVAAGNIAARALYDRAGYRECGRRKGYYQRPDATLDDAVVMDKPL
ncbi:MAG: GNAT family N-acetyltransferase [Alphaproteobacteria bacterium]